MEANLQSKIRKNDLKESHLRRSVELKHHEGKQ